LSWEYFAARSYDIVGGYRSVSCILALPDASGRDILRRRPRARTQLLRSFYGPVVVFWAPPPTRPSRIVWSRRLATSGMLDVRFEHADSPAGKSPALSSGGRSTSLRPLPGPSGRPHGIAHGPTSRQMCCSPCPWSVATSWTLAGLSTSAFGTGSHPPNGRLAQRRPSDTHGPGSGLAFDPVAHPPRRFISTFGISYGTAYAPLAALALGFRGLRHVPTCGPPGAFLFGCCIRLCIHRAGSTSCFCLPARPSTAWTGKVCGPDRILPTFVVSCGSKLEN
jgi:hypothetical protein